VLACERWIGFSPGTPKPERRRPKTMPKINRRRRKILLASHAKRCSVSKFRRHSRIYFANALRATRSTSTFLHALRKSANWTDSSYGQLAEQNSNSAVTILPKTGDTITRICHESHGTFQWIQLVRIREWS
jgi:hypothetical protein